jgi:hypothetical protein
MYDGQGCNSYILQVVFQNVSYMLKGLYLIGAKTISVGMMTQIGTLTKRTCLLNFVRKR